jgi:hypothetical protein
MKNKVVTYNTFKSNPNSNDIDRAVLPTIIYAHKEDGIASVSALCIGWWAWGFGIMRTVVKNPETQK